MTPNRKATFSSARRGLLHPKNLPFEFHVQNSRRVKGRHNKNSEFDIGPYWRTTWSKNECARFTDITTGAFALALVAVFVLPPERNPRLHGITHTLSSRLLRATHDLPRRLDTNLSSAL